MIRHVVLFSLAEAPQKSAVMEQFKAAIEDLPRSINWIRQISVRFNRNPEEEYDLVLTADFDSLDDVRRYAAHPQHVAAGRLLAPLKKARACVDFEL